MSFVFVFKNMPSNRWWTVVVNNADNRGHAHEMALARLEREQPDTPAGWEVVVIRTIDYTIDARHEALIE